MKKLVVVSVFISAIIFITIAAAGSNDFADLESFTATSILDKNIPENILDNKANTSWATMSGANVDEGILMSFEKPVEVAVIRIDDSSKFKGIEEVEVFANGVSIGIFPVNLDKKFRAPVNTKTLFFRINKINNAYLNKSVGLSVIRLMNKNNKEIKINPIEVLKGTMAASSVLKPADAYNTDLLFDSRSQFGWADGNMQETGNGEFIEFKFKKNVKISKIKIWNGYQRSMDHFKKNEAVSKMTFSNEKESVTKKLQVKFGPEIVDFEKTLSGRNFKFQIDEVRKGSRYKDLVISELRFYDGKNWFILDNGESVKRQKKIMNSISKNIISKMIDKRCYMNSGGVEQSIILRSNGSFVVYSTFSSSKELGDMGKEETKIKIVADGNWELNNASIGSAEIKIFGRKHQIKKLEEYEYNFDPYGEGYTTRVGQKTNDTEVIFSDILQITSSGSSKIQLFPKGAQIKKMEWSYQ